MECWKGVVVAHQTHSTFAHLHRVGATAVCVCVADFVMAAKIKLGGAWKVHADQVAALEQEVAAKDQRIAALEAALATEQTQHEATRNTATRLAAVCGQQADALARDAATICELNGRVAELDQRLGAAMGETVALKAQVQELQVELRQCKDSLDQSEWNVLQLTQARNAAQDEARQLQRQCE